MNRKVATAIAELGQQHDQCDIACVVNSGWKATTGSLISKYAGEESEFYHEYLEWRNTRLPYFYDEYNNAERQQAKVKLLIAHVIQHIERNGLYSPPKKRIFDGLADWQTALAIMTIAGIIFSAGYKMGEVLESKSVTKEQLKIEAQLDSFKKASKLISPVVSDSSHKKPQEKAHHHDTIKTK